ncbi:MAG: hypothetical protein J7L43_00940, partial [Candidatus Aenigmarchaeota archaeon]|nr:hypothetical protein [Candidatus Aenigmarchaeota archaeon]
DFVFVDLKDFEKEVETFIDKISHLDFSEGQCGVDYFEKDDDKTKKEKTPLDMSLVQTQDAVSTQLKADNSSTIEFQAMLYNSNDSLTKDTNYQVVFSLTSNDIVDFVGNTTVKVEDGIASVKLRAKEKVGNTTLQAKVIDDQGRDISSYPTVTRNISVVPGDIKTLSIIPDSKLLVAGGDSKTKVRIAMRDEFNNIASTSFGTITVFTDSKTYVPKNFDKNPSIEGVQIFFSEGVATFELISKEDVGKSTIVAIDTTRELEEGLVGAGDDLKTVDFSKYVGSSEEFELLDEGSVSLALTPDKSSIPANGEAKLQLKVELLKNGNRATSYNGPVNFQILTPSLLRFEKNPPSKLTDGFLHELNNVFVAETKAGFAELLVDVPGFARKTIKIKLNAGDPSKIELTSDDSVILSNGKGKTVLNATVKDKFDNTVFQNNGTKVTFNPTSATANRIVFTSSQTAVTKNGVASVPVKSTDYSGVINIVASSSEGSLTSGKLTMTSLKRVLASEIKKISPHTLYISLLGGSFGNVFSKDTLGQKLLYQGETQAVTSITTSISGNKSLLSVDGFGQTEVSSSINVQAVQSTDNFPYQQLIFSDSLNNEDLAKVFFVPKTDLKLNLIQDSTNMADKDGIFVLSLLPDTPDVGNISQESNKIVFKRNGATKFTVDKFGRIDLFDDNFTLKVNKASYFSLLIIDGDTPVANIAYKQTGAPVKALNDASTSSFTPGIYIQKLTNSSNYALKNIFTGSSTANPHGIALVDKTLPLDINQVPGSTYSPLETAGKREGIGFKGDNKNILLFSAGNSVGESNVPYASEIGINLGDPTIRLKIDKDNDASSLTGFSRDIGTPILTDNKSVLDIIKMDYNGDNREDILVVYSDGFIRLLENRISNSALHD